MVSASLNTRQIVVVIAVVLSVVVVSVVLDVMAFSQASRIAVFADMNPEVQTLLGDSQYAFEEIQGVLSNSERLNARHTTLDHLSVVCHSWRSVFLPLCGCVS